MNLAGATFQKTGGTENNRFDWAFDNAGSVLCSSGAITFNEGGLSSGSFAPSGSGLVQFTNGTHDLITGATFGGTGKLQVYGGLVRGVNPVTWNTSAGLLELIGGTVTSAPSGSVNVQGNITWTGGAIAGTFNVQPGSNFLITGSAGRDLGSGGVINNSGNAIWTGPAAIRGYDTTRWNNKSGSIFTMAADGDVFSQYNGNNIFTNEAGATFIKSVGGSATDAWSYIDEWTFNNAGTISSQQGTLHFNTILNLNPGSALAGAGRVLLNGTTNLSTQLTSSGHLELVSTLNGTNPDAGYTGTHPMVWSSGVINGQFRLAAGSVVELTSTASKWLGTGAVLNNFGLVNWRDSGLLRGYDTSTFNNEAGAIFDLVGDGDVFGTYNGNNVFNNKAGATILKSIGAATNASAYFDEWTINNSGMVNVLQGTLHLNTTFNLNAGSQFAGAGKLLLDGTTNLNAALVSTANQELVGILNATTPGSSFTGSRPLVWSNGWITGTFRLESGSVCDLATSATKSLGGGSVFTNKGRVNWRDGGPLRGYDTSTFNNEAGGVFNAVTDGDIFSQYNGNNVFQNKAGALFLKSGRSADAAGVSWVDEWRFNNYGTIQSDDGTLQFHTALWLYPDGLIAHSGTLPALVRSSYYLVLTGTTTVRNIRLLTADWHGNLEAGTAGNGTIATDQGGVFEWSGGTAHNTVNLAPGSNFQLTGGFKQIGGGGHIQNAGTATWTSGELRGYDTSTFTNLPTATFVAAADAAFTNYNGNNTFRNAGRLVLSAPAGITRIDWNYQQTATGRLDFDLAGTAPGQFDQLQLGGFADLAGNIGVSLVGNYTPVPNSAFPVITFPSRTGTLTPILSLGDFVTHNYQSNSLILVAKDYPQENVAWKQYHFGDPNSPAAQPLANPSGDGVPNLLKYALGQNPNNGGSFGLGLGSVAQAEGYPSLTVEQGGQRYLAFAFTRPAGAAVLTDVGYSAERASSVSLRDWAAADTVIHSITPGPGPDRETVIMRSTHPMSAASREFLRLRVNLLP